jgi:hypothetical protein
VDSAGLRHACRLDSVGRRKGTELQNALKARTQRQFVLGVAADYNSVIV